MLAFSLDDGFDASATVELPSESIIVTVMTVSHPRPATRADLPHIRQVRHGTTENRLTNPELVTDDEVAWYLEKAIFLVSEEDKDIRGFICANQQTGFGWALFVIDEAQGRGHETALLDAAIDRLRAAGHRQSFLMTGKGTKAENLVVKVILNCPRLQVRRQDAKSAFASILIQAAPSVPS
jgi:GNAT superfamily N-acetyltransferase